LHKLKKKRASKKKDIKKPCVARAKRIVERNPRERLPIAGAESKSLPKLEFDQTTLLTVPKSERQLSRQKEPQKNRGKAGREN